MYLLVLNTLDHEEILVNPVHIISMWNYKQGSCIETLTRVIYVKQTLLQILQALGVEACDGVTVPIGEV